MKKTFTLLAIAAALSVNALTAGAATNSGTHAPKGNVTVVANGAKSCYLPNLVLWYKYSNGYTWLVKQRLRTVDGQFIVTRDPQGRALPKSVLVHYTASICVTFTYGNK